MRPKKIISGGQTGGDQGGLDGATRCGIPTGGWMPKGCLTEKGPRRDLLEKYGMREHRSPRYPDRTWANVRDSDGTVWFGKLNSAGYHCTHDACDHFHKPWAVITSVSALREFVEKFDIKILNVAGNRESKNPGIHEFTAKIIFETFKGNV